MSTAEHYGKSTTANLAAGVLSTAVGIGPYKGPCRYRRALGTRRPTTTRKTKREPWPPPEFPLPSTREAIERGRLEPTRPAPDDSREGRLARLTGQPVPTNSPSNTPAADGRQVPE